MVCSFLSTVVKRTYHTDRLLFEFFFIATFSYRDKQLCINVISCVASSANSSANSSATISATIGATQTVKCVYYFFGRTKKLASVYHYFGRKNNTHLPARQPPKNYMSAYVSANASAYISAYVSANISAYISAYVSATISAYISAYVSANISAYISANIALILALIDRGRNKYNPLL